MITASQKQQPTTYNGDRPPVGSPREGGGRGSFRKKFTSCELSRENPGEISLLVGGGTKDRKHYGKKKEEISSQPKKLPG